MNSCIEPGTLFKRSHVYLCISRDDQYTTVLAVEITFKTQYYIKFSNKTLMNCFSDVDILKQSIK